MELLGGLGVLDVVVLVFELNVRDTYSVLEISSLGEHEDNRRIISYSLHSHCHGPFHSLSDPHEPTHMFESQAHREVARHLCLLPGYVDPKGRIILTQILCVYFVCRLILLHFVLKRQQLRLKLESHDVLAGVKRSNCFKVLWVSLEQELVLREDVVILLG